MKFLTSPTLIVRRSTSFVEIGYGKSVDLAEPWKERERVRHRWWSEFGGAPDPYDIPSKIRQVHLAIMDGSDRKREKEQRKAKMNSKT